MTTPAAPPDTLLSALGNKTRRRILELLAEEPRYILQLSKELDVTMPAVQKHLQVLEEAGLVTSYERESDLPAPSRRYFKLSASIYLTVGIAEDFVQVRAAPIGEAPKALPNQISELERDVTRLEGSRDVRERLRQAKSLLARIDEAVEELDGEKIALLGLRQRVRRAANEAIRQVSRSGLERKVLQTLLRPGKPRNAEVISAELEIRERTVEDILAELDRKGLALGRPGRAPPEEPSPDGSTRDA